MPNKKIKSTKQSRSKRQSSHAKDLIPYLSWSRVDVIERQPNEYIERYIYGKEIKTKAMEFGTLVTEALEGRNVTEMDEVLRAVKTLVPSYPQNSHEIIAYFMVGKKKVKYVGEMDGFDPKIPRVGEYKTSLYPWTKQKAKEHGQMKLYAWAHWKNTKVIPEVELTWLETVCEDGEYALTGNFLTHRFTYTTQDMLETEARLIKAYKKIEKLLAQELSVC